MSRIPHVFFLIVIFSTIFFPHAQAEDAVIPIPENYFPKGRVSEYIQDAYTYLTRYPSSRFSPRIALDILMVAERIGDKNLADNMKLFLMFEHSQSLQGIHVLTTFKDTEEFRDFILEHAEDQLSKNPVLFPHQFSKIFNSGLNYFKNNLINDGNFLLISYCLLNAAGDIKTAGILLPALENISQEDTRIAGLLDICMDQRITAAEKVIKLHGQKEETRFLETFYLSTLSEEEKKQPSIARILISNAIKAKDYKTAQLQIAAMPDSFRDDSQILFWQGWIQYSLHKDLQAIETFSNLNEKYPKDRWANASRVYMEGIRNFDRYNKTIARSVFAALEVLRSGISILQAKVKFAANFDDGIRQPHLVYIGLLLEKNFLELLLYRNDEIILGYRTSHIDSAIYLAGRNKIITFNEPAAIPVPSVSLQREEDDEFTLSAGLEFFSSIKEAGVKTSSLFDSPYLSTIDGVNELLEHAARRNGWVPVNPVTKNGDTILSWHAASIDSSDLKHIECKLSKNAIITQFKYDNLSIDDLQYSKDPSFQLISPAWPPYPVEKNETFNFPILMEFLGAVMKLFSGEH